MSTSTLTDERPIWDREAETPWTPSTVIVQRVMARRVTEWDANASRPETQRDADAGRQRGGA